MPESHVTFVTTTSYGSWLPGDARGYVHHGHLLPANPMLERHARLLLDKQPVFFDCRDRSMLFAALLEACNEFGYRPFDFALEAWHAHWVVRHGDKVASMVGRLKNRMRQQLGRGRIWTEGYCHRIIETDEDLDAASQYVRQHSGCRVSRGTILGREESPGKAGG
jgi:hypothetical protein